jgi:hypothetical protein
MKCQRLLLLAVLSSLLTPLARQAAAESTHSPVVPGLVGKDGSYALGTAPQSLHRQLRAARRDYGR